VRQVVARLAASFAPQVRQEFAHLFQQLGQLRVALLLQLERPLLARALERYGSMSARPVHKKQRFRVAGRRRTSSSAAPE